jgi:biopolymer transport protein ExbB
LLEAVIAMSPLLGLLGTVLGLYQTLKNVTVGVLETAEGQKAAGGIGESLVSTAAGLGVALLSLAIYRIFQTLTLKQASIFRRAGNELELLQRQKWQYDRSRLSGGDFGSSDRDSRDSIDRQDFTTGG